MPTRTARAVRATWRARIVASPQDAREALAQPCVNTSLSGTLFFLMSLLYFE